MHPPKPIVLQNVKKKKKMKSIGVFLLVLVMCCEGCWKEERDALLILKSHIGYMVNMGSWEDDTDCCVWERVTCNTTTRRVAQLDLAPRDDVETPWHLNFSDFIVFKDLKTLNLRMNQILGCVETHQGLKNLEVLDLSVSDFHNATSMLSCWDGLSSLKSLSLGSLFNMDSTPFDVLHTFFETLSSKLLHLEVLEISGNELTNNILPSLKRFTSLNELYLSNIGLDSDLHIRGLCAVLKNLEVLDISYNNFTDTDIASALSGLLSLKSLNLIVSGITPRSIHNISKLGFLEILDLFGNDLNESLLWTPENDGFAWPASLQVLGLSSNGFGNSILSSVNKIPGLKSLDLSHNQLNGSLHISDFRDMSYLEELVLDNSELENEFFRDIGELTSLKVLRLSNCNINGTLLGKDWSKLKKLVELDLSSNGFTGPLPSSFVNITSLRTLKLAHNHFTGNIGLNLASLTSLEYLSFEDNQFEFPISFTPFVNNSKLKFIYGNGNKVILDSHSTLEKWVPKFQIQELQLSSTTDFKSIPLPNFLLYQYNLTNLDFSGCKLGGEFPNWLLENNTNMKMFVLRNCSFTGEFKLPLPTHPLVNMEKIDISDNAIKGQLQKNISSIFPSLLFLYMHENALYGSIPYELSQMNSLLELDLSDNQLSGEIPYNISKAGQQQLRFLKLSRNKLHGSMPSLWSNANLDQLFLDGNFLSGSIPTGFYNSSAIFLVDLSNNYFTGEISSHVKNLSHLESLDISNNHFKGSIPSELAELEELEFLDLSENYLTGCVPSFAKSSGVRFIHLASNNLSCLSKKMFSANSYPLILDLSYNIINGIHDLARDLSYTNIRILLVCGNQLTGNIPKQLCQLESLNILDLSSNNFSGEIPNCLGKILVDIEPDMDFNEGQTHLVPYTYGDHDASPTVQEKANFTSKRRTETYTGSILIYMSGIDLSCNKLNGSIPSTLGNLTKVRALNLSHNYLTGEIPPTFSNLLQVESLDLSFNMLSGQIPPQLCGLTSLEVFSVAYNNLSGATPEWKEQFATFDESSYEGNQFPCGPPLPKSCNDNGQASATLPNVSNEDGDHDDWMDMYGFRVSFVVAYPSVLLVIATVLYINPYWRQAWFYYVELVRMNCYYFIEDHLLKFF